MWVFGCVCGWVDVCICLCLYVYVNVPLEAPCTEGAPMVPQDVTIANLRLYKNKQNFTHIYTYAYRGAGKLRNLGARGAPSSQILRALTKFYGPSMILFRT